MPKITGTFLVHAALVTTVSLSGIYAQTTTGDKLRDQLAAGIAEGNLTAVQQALEAGAGITEVHEGKSAWYLAVTADKYQPDIAKLFKPQPGDLERAGATLHSAALSNNSAYIEHLAKSGVDLNTRSADAAKQTPLMIAAFDGFSASVRVLLAHGADVTLKDSTGQTALSIAKTAVKEKRWIQSDLGVPEADYRMVVKLLENGKSEILVGKVFEANDKLIQITGKEILKLKKGQRILVKASNGNIRGVVTEILHTKARATLSGVGAKKGDPVVLSGN